MLFSTFNSKLFLLLLPAVRCTLWGLSTYYSISYIFFNYSIIKRKTTNSKFRYHLGQVDTYDCVDTSVSWIASRSALLLLPVSSPHLGCPRSRHGSSPPRRLPGLPCHSRCFRSFRGKNGKQGHGQLKDGSSKQYEHDSNNIHLNASFVFIHCLHALYGKQQYSLLFKILMFLFHSYYELLPHMQ